MVVPAGQLNISTAEEALVFLYLFAQIAATFGLVIRVDARGPVRLRTLAGIAAAFWGVAAAWLVSPGPHDMDLAGLLVAITALNTVILGLLAVVGRGGS